MKSLQILTPSAIEDEDDEDEEDLLAMESPGASPKVPAKKEQLLTASD